MFRHSLFLFLKTLAYLSLFALGASIILWVAWLSQSAAETMDRGIRPLGSSNYQSPPGPVYIENDSYYWLLMAERMREEGNFRIRWTTADNVPMGRPVYWSQSIAWLIRGLAALPPFRDKDAPLAAASFWVNPLLQILVLCGLILLLAPLGWKLTGVTAAFFVTLGDVGWAFSSLRPDHQSLQAAFAILMVAALFREGFGFGRPRIENADHSDGNTRAEAWVFVLAGLCAGAGLWVSAAAFMPILVVLAVAVCGVALFGAANDSKADPHSPRLWLVWGLTAGIASFFFWLVEFLPDLDLTRLEVNNPAFAFWVFLLGCGMALALGLSHSPHRPSRSLFALSLIALACMTLPAIILFGPVTWYWPRDVAMDRLHNFIMEFYTFQNFTKGKVLLSLWQLYYFVLPLGLCLLIPACMWPDVRSRYGFWVLLALLGAFFAMGLRQIRWFFLFAPTLAMAAGVSATCLAVRFEKIKGAGRLLSHAVVLACFLQASLLASNQLRALEATASGRSVMNEIMPAVLNKHFMCALRDTPNLPQAVMADPNLAPALYYFARIPSVASFYWENLQGVRDAAAFFADEADGLSALEVTRRRGITHVIVPSGSLFPNYFDFVKHGYFDTNRARRTLAGTLTQGSILSLPSWLETDDRLDQLGKMPFSYKGETIEQYLNVYRVNPQKFPN
jgi:hypothetical protein